MRILHTSDWHLGARLCDRDRIEEHNFFLRWLIDTIDEKSIDIVLIAGDIFDSTNPPNSAEQLYYDFLCSIKDTNCTAVVVVGGNHDSISKLNSPKELLSRMSVFVNGGINESPSDDVLEISGKNGEPLAIISAVPYLRERDIHIPVAGETWQERENAVLLGIKNYYRQTLSAAEKKKEDSEVPIIAMGHLFATGSLNGAGQRDLYVGNLGAVSGDIFPEEFTYTALGHIHRSQKVGGKENIRYSGSPLHMDFGETDNKEIIIVDFDKSEIQDIQTIPIPLSKDLIRFKGNFEEVCRQIDDFQVSDLPFWADAEVTGGDSVGDISKILNEKASEKGFDFLRIKTLSKSGERIISTEESVEIGDLTVEEVFIRRCEKAGLSDAEMNELIPLHNELLNGLEL